MKIKLIALLLAVITCLSTLASCGGGDTPPDGEDDGTTETPGGTGDGSGDGSGEGSGDTDKDESAPLEFSAIIYSSTNALGLNVRDIVNKYQVATGKRLQTRSDAFEPTDGEIVLGDTTRTVTAKAKRQLRRYLTMDTVVEWDTASYIIYVKDGSVSVYWDSNYSADKAIDRLIELIADGSLKNGFKETYSTRTTAEKREAEKLQREASILKVEQLLGKEAADAVVAHLSLATEDFYMWLADLYEPRTCICDNYDENGYRVCLLPKDSEGNYLCHGGGFYYSNSGRDTEGYDIDIESTVQAINFLSSAGMLAEYGGDTAKALPQQMKNDVVAFAKSLQSPVDGYFYHPQWGESIGTSRLGRDLGWATQIITKFGSIPLYDAPNGTKGEKKPTGASTALVGELSESVAAAVSKVTLTAVWPNHLKTLDAFNEYLRSFDLANNSYSTGNTFASQSGQINNRDKEGLANGEFVDADKDGIADNGFVKAWETYFNSMQNPENGLWQDSVHYNSVNGLMKISSVYNSLKIKLPNAIAGFESAVEMAKLDPEIADIKGKRATGSVDVYNPWVAMSAVISNINKYGDHNDATALRKTMQENAAEMIRVTTAKTRKFAKEDGSYGYTWSSSPSNSQGAPVAVPGTIEGDINGGCIALRGIWGNMSSVLGISVPLYYPSDFDKFLYRINELGPVIKHNASDDISLDAIDFEDEDLGSNVANRISGSSDMGGIEVAKDPTDQSNLVMKLYNNPSTANGTTMTVIAAGSKNDPCNVLEWDMYFESGKNTGTAFQIRCGDGYMFTLGISNGYVTLGDSSSTGAGVKNSYPVKLPFKEWHKFRLEFYPDGDGEENIPMTKIFVDGILVARSDNFFGKEKTNAKISTNYISARFYALQSTTLVTYLDNIKANKEKIVYTPGEIGTLPEKPSDPSTPTTPPSDPSEAKYGKYSFDSVDIGSVKVDGVELNWNKAEAGNSMGVIADPKNAANKLLEMIIAPSTQAGNTVNFKINENATDSDNCYTLEMEIGFDFTYSTKSIVSQVYIKKGGNNITTSNLVFTSDGRLTIQARHNSKGSSSGNVVSNYAFGTRNTIRMEYYKDVGKVKYFIGDSYVGEALNYWDDANKALLADKATFYTTYATEAHIFIDNVTATASQKTYVQQTVTGGNTPTESKYGFYDFNSTSDTVITVDGVALDPNSAETGNRIFYGADPKSAANRVLTFETKPSSNAGNSATLLADPGTSGANCYVFEMKMSVDHTYAEKNFIMQIAQRGSNSVQITSTNLYYNTNGTIELETRPNGKNLGKRLTSDPIAITDNSFTLRMEYYKAEKIMKYYVNGKYVGEGENLWNADNADVEYVSARIYTTYATEARIHLDDITAKAITKAYVSGSVEL